MEYREFKAKTVDEAITLASTEFGCASTELDYEVIEKGSSGFLGIGAKQAVIKAKKKESFLDDIQEYLDNLFKAMDIEAKVTIDYDEAEATMDIDVEGPDMGILIGKRGQTLDSLQYLISLFVNKKSESYIRVKLDTENYRARRKDTLENLAKNISFKVKRTRRPFTLEPMNPYGIYGSTESPERRRGSRLSSLLAVGNHFPVFRGTCLGGRRTEKYAIM